MLKLLRRRTHNTEVAQALKVLRDATLRPELERDDGPVAVPAKALRTVVEAFDG